MIRNNLYGLVYSSSFLNTWIFSVTRGQALRMGRGEWCNASGLEQGISDVDTDSEMPAGKRRKYHLDELAVRRAHNGRQRGCRKGWRVAVNCSQIGVDTVFVAKTSNSYWECLIRGTLHVL